MACSLTASEWLLAPDDPSRPALGEPMAVLMAIGRGDAAALAGVPVARFQSAIGRRDPSDPERLDRWSSLIPAALAAAPDGHQPGLLRALERLALEAPSQPALLVHLLPAAAARRSLADEAARRFDRGDLAGYLAVADLLDEASPGWEAGPAQDRRGIASQLLVSSEELPPAGPLQPTKPWPQPRRDQHWRFDTGRLARLDPWGQVRWQRPLPARAQVVVSPEAVLIVGGGEVITVDAQGSVQRRPQGVAAQPWAIADGRAWLSAAGQLYRLDLRSESVQSWPLPERIHGLIAQGDRALVLLDRHLLSVGNASMERFRHGRDVAGLSFGRDREGRPLLLGQDQAWQIQPWSLASSSPREQLALLLSAERPAEAWALFETLFADPSAATDLALAACLLPAGHTAACGQAIELPVAPPLRALLRWRAGLPAVPGELPAGQLIAAGDDDDPRDPASSWAWALGPAALGPASTAPGEVGLQLESDAKHGAVLVGAGRRLQVDQDGPMVVIRAFAKDGQLAWRRQWHDPSAVPAHSLARHGSQILLATGSGHIHRLDLHDGRSQGSWQVRPSEAIVSVAAALPDGSVVLPLQPGASNEVLLLLPDGRQRRQRLPAPMRWIAPAGSLLAASDGRVLWLIQPDDGAVVSDRPHPLALGEAPQTAADGLVQAGRLWPWATLHP